VDGEKLCACVQPIKDPSLPPPLENETVCRSQVAEIQYFVIPFSLTANVVFFLVDECSSQMEAPFGDDESDIDLPKLLRRIDKHTASTLALWTGSPVKHFNLYPEAQTTSHHCRPLVRAFSKFRAMKAHSVATEVSKSTGSEHAPPRQMKRKKSLKLYAEKEVSRRGRRGAVTAVPSSPPTLTKGYTSDGTQGSAAPG
jgi:hypothetical protein